MAALPLRVQYPISVFGAYGAVVFTLLSGLLLARFIPAQKPGGKA